MTSNPWTIPYVLEEIVRLNPHNIIDIGGGRGKYAMLCREYLKNLQTIDAIEPCPKHIKYKFYDYIIGNKIEDCSLHKDYDLALMIAMVCHIKKSEVLKTVQRVKRNCKHIIMTLEKEQHGGMPQWNPDDFRGLFPDLKVIDAPHEWVVVI